MIFLAFVLGLLLAAFQVSPATAAACTTGQTTCATDTVTDTAIANAIRDPGVQQRVYDIWLQQCENIWSESSSTAGHALRVSKCNQIASQGATPLLVAAIMNSTIQSEVVGTCTLPAGQLQAGCMVDADIVTQIGAVMTVSVNSATTTATASSASNQLTVASATGLVVGQVVYAAGVPNGATVQFISGTTVYINAVTTAALSSAPVLFLLSAGLPAAP